MAYLRAQSCGPPSGICGPRFLLSRFEDRGQKRPERRPWDGSQFQFAVRDDTGIAHAQMLADRGGRKSAEPQWLPRRGTVGLGFEVERAVDWLRLVGFPGERPRFRRAHASRFGASPNAGRGWGPISQRPTRRRLAPQRRFRRRGERFGCSRILMAQARDRRGAAAPISWICQARATEKQRRGSKRLPALRGAASKRGSPGEPRRNSLRESRSKLSSVSIR